MREHRHAHSRIAIAVAGAIAACVRIRTEKSLTFFSTGDDERAVSAETLFRAEALGALGFADAAVFYIIPLHGA